MNAFIYNKETSQHLTLPVWWALTVVCESMLRSSYQAASAFDLRPEGARFKIRSGHRLSWPISWVFCRFFQACSGIVPQIRQRRPPSTFLPVRCSLVVPSNRATDVSLRNEQMTAISVYRKRHQFIAFCNSQQCYMFQSVRPSSGVKCTWFKASEIS